MTARDLAVGRLRAMTLLIVGLTAAFALLTVMALTECIHTPRYVDVWDKLERHAEQFGALGHPARLGILRRIVQGGPEGTTTTELQAELDIPWTTLNHHVDRLVAAGLVTTRRDGKFALHAAAYGVLRALTAFLWEDCCKRGKCC